MSNESGGISQNVSGSFIQGGMQAAIGNQNQQITEIHADSTNESLQLVEVLRLFSQIETEIRHSDLPEDVQAKAGKYLEAAKAEVQEKEPDKNLAAGNLKRMVETVETTSKTMESGKKIWGTIKPVLEQLSPWLGIAKTFFGV